MGSSLSGQAEFALGKLKVLMKATNKASVKVTRVAQYPSQANHHDCGVFALLGSETIMANLARSIGTDDYQSAVDKIKSGEAFKGNVSGAKATEKR